MLKTKIVVIVLATFFVLSTKQVIAQVAGGGYILKLPYRVHIGGMLGASEYAGDFQHSQAKFSFAGNATLDMTPNISLRAQLSYGSLSANRDATLSFSSDFLDFSGLFEYNFMDLYHDNDFTPYVTGGLSASSFFKRTAIGTGAIDKFTVFVPVGGGVKYIVNDNITLRLEGIFKVSFTDKLDGWKAGGYSDYISQVMIGASFRLASLLHDQRYE
ncbi:MAG: porin family protein [Chitinophagaceae bacterium]|jgi:hypothetical protein|nr:porin family protein [Chitinophagaceae bacterium]